MIKSLFDRISAGIGLVFLSPLMVLLALLIRHKLGSSVLFCQQRPGLHAKPFNIYKFRTMTDERDASGNLLPDEVRLTRFGKLLRKLSLDELPQLFNVLKGELSLVGPRPLLMEYLPLYTSEQARRHEVKPGITGWAQVNGRNAISWEEKFQLDVWYVDHQSFWLDLKILWMTVMKVVKSEGISHQGHATMEAFKGSRNHHE
jgi:sugar transferase EpsL